MDGAFPRSKTLCPSTFELVARLLPTFDETDQHLCIFSETRSNSDETGHPGPIPMVTFRIRARRGVTLFGVA